VAVDIIELEDLTKKYGSFTGLLGPNGAGKSTTILMMLGLTEPTSGSVRVCGIDSISNPIEVKRRVGYLPEDIGFYDDHTGIENLIFTARLNSMSAKEAAQKAEQLLNRVGLSVNGGKKTGKYSRGMRQRLGLADVLIKNPEIIILDEPTLGIDPTGVREFLDLIVALSKEEGITVLLSSHHLHQVQQVCDRVGLFVNGRLLAEGNIQTLSKKLFASSAYIIEAGVTYARSRSSAGSKKIQTAEELKELLQQIKGISAITIKDDRFKIECSEDVTADIARTIVKSGAGLYYLNKKEYGLDDIYYRYFEGGADHE
jgi:ABC-2 type transport system ATP-binding protein